MEYSADARHIYHRLMKLIATLSLLQGKCKHSNLLNSNHPILMMEIGEKMLVKV